MSQDAPSNASKLVGERDGEDVVMQPLLGRFEPRLEAVALPALGLDQHYPCCLHKRDPQVAIAAFRYLAKDGAVAGRDLPGDEPQPGGEVAALRERITTADRSYDCAGDDRPDPWYTHQAAHSRHPGAPKPRSRSIDPRCAHRAGASPLPGPRVPAPCAATSHRRTRRECAVTQRAGSASLAARPCHAPTGRRGYARCCRVAS